MTLINQASLLKQEIDMRIETPTDSKAALKSVTLGILGFIYAFSVYYIPASIAASAVRETGNTFLMKISLLIQFAVGLSVSVIAYSSAWDRSFKLGMRACYGLAIGLVMATGVYTILTSI